MDNGRCTFQRLHQIRFDRVLEQHCHGTGGVQITSIYRLPSVGEADENIPQSPLQIVQVIGKTQNRHDLRSRRNVESSFARDPK